MLRFTVVESNVVVSRCNGSVICVLNQDLGIAYTPYFMSLNLNFVELRQIAAKLLELNGGNTLQFIEQDDGVINIQHECGSAIGDLVKRDGVYRLTFLYTYDNVDGLYQIADKLQQLNKE